MIEGSRLHPDLLPDKRQLAALIIPCLVCCYLVITSTTDLFPEIPAYDTKRIGEFILLFVAFLATLSITSLRNAFASQLSRLPLPIGLGIALFFTLGVTSSFVNADSIRGLVYSLVDVGLLGLLFVLTLIIAAGRTIAGIHFDRVALSAIALLGLAVGVQELVGFWAAWSLGLSYNFEIALAYFSFPRMYNHLQTWTIPVLTALPFIFFRNKLAAVLCIMALGLHWYVLLVTGARGSVISLVVAFSIAALLNPLARKAILKWQLAGILFGVLIYAGMFLITESSGDRTLVNAQSPAPDIHESIPAIPSQISDEGSILQKSNKFYNRSVGRPMLHTTGRTGLWKLAIKDVQENPILGIGPMNFACKGPLGRVGSPHNLAFQVLSEWGIPAALVLLVLSLTLLWTLLKGLLPPKLDKTHIHVLHLMLITSVLAALVHLMVSSLLLTPASQVAAALTGGWLLGFVPQKQVHSKSTSGTFILTLTLTCSLLLLPFAYHEMIEMPYYSQHLPAGEEGIPRLWQLGKVCSNTL